jgi:uncharacterized protein YkwD
LRTHASRRLRRLVALPVLLTAVAVPATASAAPCVRAGSSPAKLGEAGVRRATLCLLNRARAAHGLRPLGADPRLAKAALGHSTDMVRHRYFAHKSRSGAPFTARIAATGWTRSHHRYVVGENIGWGTPKLASPRAMVRRWMHSPEHRANILQPRYRLIGIGVALGIPVAGRSGATYSTDFGG